MTTYRYCFSLLLTMLAMHCDDSASQEQADSGPALSYASDIQPIWDQYCIRCHFRPIPALELSEARSYQDLTSGFSNWAECGRFVVPGRPEESLLFFKISGTYPAELHGGCQRSMPADWEGQGDTPLAEIDPVAVEKVRHWILAGARE